MDVKKYFKIQGDNIEFTGEYLEVYVPLRFEESGLYEDLGDSVEVIGVLNLRVFEKNKPGKLKTLNLPTTINMYPSEKTRQKLKLLAEREEDDSYIVLKFFKGDVLTNKSTRIDSTNVERFLGMITSGKIPNTIAYSSIIKLWHKNLQLNSVSLGVPSNVLELLITEIYRYKKDPALTFGSVRGKNPAISDYDYRAANMRETCSRSSVFAAVTFEDMDAMLTSSINMTNYNKKQTISPIEKIIKM